MLHAVINFVPLGVVEAVESADQIARDAPNALEPDHIGRECQLHVLAVKLDVQRSRLDIGVLLRHVIDVRRDLRDGHSVGNFACSYHAVSSFRA